jgi:hypothetical protein
MEDQSAAGDGTSDGTSVTERDTSMDEMRPRGKWSDSELDQVKFLHASNSTSKIAKIFRTTKNAIIGALYRDKIRNGYIPPEDSKYTGPKNL